MSSYMILNRSATTYPRGYQNYDRFWLPVSLNFSSLKSKIKIIAKQGNVSGSLIISLSS